ncbi:M1 family aminopeptidase [Embleya sp. NPDC059237]|uniref:M1 family aminopeptidase n=1 Tax=Embleya sp. NPDC059237 TaxID=3346784 RepID=UPI003691B9C0
MAPLVADFCLGAPFDSLLVHECTHQWFGNGVSFTDWRDGCLAECVAQYANQLWDEHVGADLDTGFYPYMFEESRNDPRFWSTKLYDPGRGRELDGGLYFKGSMKMHALCRTTGDTAFFDAWAHGTTALADKYLYPGTLGPLKPNRP